MATTGLLRVSRPSFSNFSNSSMSYSTLTVLKYQSEPIYSGENRLIEDGGKRKQVVAVKASVSTSESVTTAEPQTKGEVDLASLSENVKNVVLRGLKVVTKRRRWNLHVQMFIERVILDCRFFTLFAVAGSLLGSVLCFVEGSFMILESYLQYFHCLSQKSDQGHIMQLLIEAIDMFLVGTAMLIFGVGIYVMFVGLRNLKGKGSQIPGSNFFGLFHLETLPSWIGMQTVTQAKSKIGHAMMMILQVGVLDKLKSIPLVTGADLACFAGTVFISSACVFILSKLSVGGAIKEEHR